MARTRQRGPVSEAAGDDEVIDLREESAPEMPEATGTATTKGSGRRSLMSRLHLPTRDDIAQEASADLDRWGTIDPSERGSDEWEFDPRLKGGRGPSTVHLRRMSFLEESEESEA